MKPKACLPAILLLAVLLAGCAGEPETDRTEPQDMLDQADILHGKGQDIAREGKNLIRKGNAAEKTAESKAHYEEAGAKFRDASVYLKAAATAYRRAGNNESAAAAERQAEKLRAPDRIHVETAGSPAKGRNGAPVTIIEFSDFECSFCSAFFRDTLPQIQEQYVSTGKAKLVYKHLPINFHPQAIPAALASECAREQGRFWEYHDILFLNQESLGSASYTKWAGDLGLNPQQFSECLESRKHQDRVTSDAQQAVQAGISGAPGFLVNGIPISGSQPFSVFRQVIEEELEGID